MNRRLFASLFAAVLFTGFAGTAAHAQSSNWTIDKNHAEITFAIRHMGVSTVRGSISGITGDVVWDGKNPATASVNATIDANTLTTNNDARDKHLKSPDFFNVAEFPTLAFKATSIQRVHGKRTVAVGLTGATLKSVRLSGGTLVITVSRPARRLTVEVVVTL